MRFRHLLSACLLLAATAPHALHAQPAARRTLDHVPITLSVTLPTGRPTLTTRTFLLQSGAGMLGGIVAGSAVALPMAMASWGGRYNETLFGAVIVSAYFGGTMAGIHHVGRAHGMSGNPLATAGGILGGLLLAGAAMQPSTNEEGEVTGPAPLLVFVAPGFGGAGGYALTRQAR
jgi:hypothetical protein